MVKRHHSEFIHSHFSTLPQRFLLSVLTAELQSLYHDSSASRQQKISLFSSHFKYDSVWDCQTFWSQAVCVWGGACFLSLGRTHQMHAIEWGIDTLSSEKEGKPLIDSQPLFPLRPPAAVHLWAKSALCPLSSPYTHTHTHIATRYAIIQALMVTSDDLKKKKITF